MLADAIVLRLVGVGKITLSTALTVLELSGVPVVVAASVVVLWREGFGAVRPPHGGELLPALIYVVLFSCLLVVTWIVWESITNLPRREVAEMCSGVHENMAITALNLLAIALGEECIYRGAVYQALRGTVRPTSAAVLSAGLFACAHWHDVPNMVYTFLFGLLAVWLVARFRTLFVPVLFHWVMNLVIASW